MNSNKQPLVSIIVPVYNGEKTIRKTIDSIIGQSYSNIEIIIVNDGSTDSTKNILENYEEKIIAINKKNGGVGSARNEGIKNAHGEYIMFVDADDICENNMVKDIIEYQRIINADCIVASYTSIKDKENYTTYALEEKVFSSKADIRNNLSFIMFQGLNRPFSKLYKKNILNSEGIFFDETIPLGEDINFNLRYILAINSVAYLNKSLYLYMLDNCTATTKYREDYYEVRSRAIDVINNTLAEEKIENPYDEILRIKVVYASIFNLMKKQCPLSRNEKIKKINEMQKHYLMNCKMRKLDSKLFKLLRCMIKRFCPTLLYLCGIVISKTIHIYASKMNHGISV